MAVKKAVERLRSLDVGEGLFKRLERSGQAIEQVLGGIGVFKQRSVCQFPRCLETGRNPVFYLLFCSTGQAVTEKPGSRGSYYSFSFEMISFRRAVASLV